MSTLTPEQRARIDAIQEASNAYAAQKEGEPYVPLVDFMFLAGCRYQHERTREAAAKVCAASAEKALAAQSGKDDYMNEAIDRNLRMMSLLPNDCADAIRALTLDEC